MRQISLILLLVFTISACSARVVFEPQPTNAASPNAVNINTATADELEKLPRIGLRTAEAIVDHRTRHGAFRRVEHLMLIRGVSESRFGEIQPLVRTE